MTELPKDWEIVDFESCIEQDNTPSKIKLKQSNYQEKGKFPIIDQGQKFIAGYSDDITKVFPNEGDSVVFGDHTRIVKFVNFPFCVGADGTKVLRVRKNILIPKFFYYQLKWTPIENAGYSRHYRFLKRKKIIVPPLDKQRQIIKILERAEDLIGKRKQANQMANRLLQAVFLQMFGDPSRFNLCQLDDIADGRRHSLSSGPFGSNLTSKDYVKEGVTVLRGLNVSEGKLNLTNVKYVSEEKARSLIRSEIKPDDVVVIAVGSSGKALTIPKELPRAIMSQNFNKITPNLKKVNPIYLEYSINSSFVQEQLTREVTDTVRTFLSLTKLRRTKIPVPPMPLQNKFVNIVREISLLKEKQSDCTNKISQLFSSLVSKAFKGELVQ